MTYCVGLKLNEGLVMLSDTRTNAGVDNISRYRKMFTWEVAGERAICLMTAGNLSITQGVITRLEKQIERSATEEGETILNAPSIFRVAEIVGEQMRLVQETHREAFGASGLSADATIMVAGQRLGGQPRLFMVYSVGNFIEATDDTPYLQIGEHKYGKPILDRVMRIDLPMADALKAAFVSMDSTLRSNLSVGMPLDLAVIRSGEFRFGVLRRIDAEDPEFTMISNAWSEALRHAFGSIPNVSEFRSEPV